MTHCLTSLRRCFHRNAILRGKSIPCMNLKCSASARARNTGNMNLATKYQSYAPLPSSSLGPSHSVTNMTDIASKSPFYRWNALAKGRSGNWQATGDRGEERRLTAPESCYLMFQTGKTAAIHEGREAGSSARERE